MNRGLQPVGAVAGRLLQRASRLRDQLPPRPVASSTGDGVCPSCLGARFLTRGLADGPHGTKQSVTVECPACGLHERVVRSGVPFKYVRLDDHGRVDRDKPALDMFEDQFADADRSSALVRTYAKLLPASARDGMGLYLWGDTGRGKTHMAAKVGLTAIKAGVATRFFTTDDFLSATKRTWDKAVEDRQREAREWLDQQAKAELVIVDDFASERLSPWALGEVFRLINDCVNAGKAIVATSNLSLDKVERLLEGTDQQQSHRIVSRLRGAVVETEVLTVGDYRAAQGVDMRQELEAAAGIVAEQGA